MCMDKEERKKMHIEWKCWIENPSAVALLPEQKQTFAFIDFYAFIFEHQIQYFISNAAYKDRCIIIANKYLKSNAFWKRKHFPLHCWFKIRLSEMNSK